MSPPTMTWAVVEHLEGRFGRLDILINNAGVQYSDRFRRVVDLNAIETEIAVNLTGPIKLTALALELLERAGGAVVNISSGTAWAPKPDGAIYSATKAGLTSFSRGIRRPLAEHGVRVVEVYPPVTSTTMTAGRARAMATAEWVAERIVAGLSSDADQVVIGNVRALRFIHRISPRLAESVMAREK